MNERYAYGYNTGWNVENEYIDELKPLMEPFIAENDKIITEAEELIRNRGKEIDDDLIRNSYNEFYADNGALESFEHYSERIKEENNKKFEQRKKEIEDAYAKNINEFMSKNDITRRKLSEKQEELELKLTRAELDLKEILYNQTIAIKDKNYEKSRELKNDYDKTFLEVKKLEHALKYINSMRDIIKKVEEKYYAGEKLDINDYIPKEEQPKTETVSEDNPVTPAGTDEPDTIEESPERDNIPDDSPVTPAGTGESDTIEESPEKDSIPDDSPVTPTGTDESDTIEEGPEKDNIPKTPPVHPVGTDEPNEEIPNVEDEEPVKVVETTPWQWIKDHKKQILIALGLTALAISTIVLVTQLLPAMLAAQKASMAAGLASQMTANGSAWFAATTAEQAALHGANTALAGQLSALTGMSNAFNATTGLWTIGGKSLATVVPSLAAKAAAAQSAASALGAATIGTNLTGLGLLGTGLLLQNRSEEYKRIIKEIKELNNNSDEMSEEEFLVSLNNIHEEIENSNELSHKEKEMLYKKIRMLAKKQANKSKEQPEITNNNPDLEEEPANLPENPESTGEGEEPSDLEEEPTVEEKLETEEEFNFEDEDDEMNKTSGRTSR